MRSSSHRKGFALVLSLALTGLVLALVLTFSSWIQFSARKVAVQKHNASARDLAYAALQESLFELRSSWSPDTCVIAVGPQGQLMGFNPESDRAEVFGDKEQTWAGNNGELLSCAYHIGLCGEDMLDGLLVGGLLTCASRSGFRENIQTTLLSSHEDYSAFGESSGLYGPLSRMLSSYVDVCGAAATGKALNAQGYGPGGSEESFIPFAHVPELFLKTRPRFVHDGGSTTRGDPVFFGLHPWLCSIEVSYALRVERLDVYYVPRIFESVSVRLYNPYDVALTESRYCVLGVPPELTARVGDGPDRSVLLEHEWAFSSSFEPGELKTIHIPSRMVYEFSPLLEQPGKVYFGLAGGLPEVRKKLDSVSAGSGRALREAFMNRRRMAQAEKVAANKPEAAHQVRFYLEEKDASKSLLQRVTDASVQFFDIAHGNRSAIEKFTWELPPLQVLAQQEEWPIVAWDYEANGALPNPGAPIVFAGGRRGVCELTRLHLPRDVCSRVDLLLGLRSFYASDPLLFSAQGSSAWTKKLGAVLWDDYFYPLSQDHYCIYPRDFSLQGELDPGHILLKGAMSINVEQAQRWVHFLKRFGGLNVDQSERLAQALSEAISRRIPLRSVFAFWESGGILDEALSLSGVGKEIDKETFFGSFAELLVLRPDTFLVQTQGSLRHENDVLAKAACEAVVQRFPDDNEGRTYKIVAFRWR